MLSWNCRKSWMIMAIYPVCAIDCNNFSPMIWYLKYLNNQWSTNRLWNLWRHSYNSCTPLFISEMLSCFAGGEGVSKEEALSKEIQSFFFFFNNILCAQGWGRSGLSMVLVYIEFLIHTGVSREVHWAQGSRSEQSLREGSVVQVGIYHVFCGRDLRGRRCDWWTDTQSLKAGALGIGGAWALARVWAGRTHLALHCSVFLGLPFHDCNICK